MSHVSLLVAAAEVVGDDLRFEEHLVAPLWQRRVLVRPVSAPRGLYEAVLSESGDALPPARVTEVTPAELLARPTFVAWVTTSPAVGTRSQQDVVGTLRKVSLGYWIASRTTLLSRRSLGYATNSACE